MSTQTIQWAEALHGRIANAIKQAREGRFTAQQLANETQRLGHPISRSQIANIESGRKQAFDVAELLILAAALRVPPISLLFPALPDGDAEPLPGWHTTAADGLGWFTGEIVDEDDDAEPSDEARLVALTRRRFRAESKVKQIRAGLELAQLVGKRKAQVVDRVLDLANMGEEIADLNRQIATIPGAVVPPQSKEGTK